MQYGAVVQAGMHLAKDLHQMKAERDRALDTLRDARYKLMESEHSRDDAVTEIQTAQEMAAAALQELDDLKAQVLQSEAVQEQLHAAYQATERSLQSYEASDVSIKNLRESAASLALQDRTESIDEVALQAELGLCQDRLAQAQSHLSTLHQQQLASKAHEKELRSYLETTKADYAQTRTELQRYQQQCQDAVAQIHALEKALEGEKGGASQLRTDLAEQKSAVRAQQEQVRLTQREADVARSRARGLEYERSSLIEALRRAQPFEALYQDLFSSSKSVLLQLKAAESQVNVLTQENLQLASHTNPEQKIVYLDGVRRQLTTSRHRIGELESHLEEQRTANAKLVGELKAVQAFEHKNLLVGTGGGGRVTRIAKAANIDS